MPSWSVWCSLGLCLALGPCGHLYLWPLGWLVSPVPLCLLRQSGVPWKVEPSRRDSSPPPFFSQKYGVTILPTSGCRGFPGGWAVENLPAVQEMGVRSLGPQGRSPGEGNGYPLQYCCLENPMERCAWRATVRGVAESRTQLKQLSRQAGVPWGQSSLKLTARLVDLVICAQD